MMSWVMRGKSGAPGRSAPRVGSSKSSWIWRIAAADWIDTGMKCMTWAML